MTEVRKPATGARLYEVYEGDYFLFATSDKAHALHQLCPGDVMIEREWVPTPSTPTEGAAKAEAWEECYEATNRRQLSDDGLQVPKLLNPYRPVSTEGKPE